MPVETTEIIQAAEKLGQLVAQHPAIAKYRDAQKAVAEDPDAKRLLTEFDRQIESLHRAEQTGQPPTDAQRQQLEMLQQQLSSQLKIKSMSIAQVEFTDLLRKVSQAWQKPLAEGMGVAPGAPRGPARM